MHSRNAVGVSDFPPPSWHFPLGQFPHQDTMGIVLEGKMSERENVRMSISMQYNHCTDGRPLFLKIEKS